MQDLLNQAFACETRNEWDNAVQCYLKALELKSGDKDILLNLAASLFNNGDYEQALDSYVNCYKHPLQTDEERSRILQFILDAYYQSNETTFKTNYERNINLIKSYQYNYLADFPMFDQLDYCCIPASDFKMYILKKETKAISDPIRMSIGPHNYEILTGDCVIAVDVYSFNALELILDQTEDNRWFNGMKTPVYVIWRESVLACAFLQVIDYHPILSKERLVFFDSFNIGSRFEEFLKDRQVYFPNKMIVELADQKKLNQVLEDIYQFKEADIEKNKLDIIQKYQHYTREYYQRLFQKPVSNIRMLFFASRFTQVVQYTIKDFMEGCRRAGVQCDYLTEKIDLHHFTYSALIAKIAEFNPDIVFLGNYMKSDYGEIPENLMFVTWVQDPVKQINSKHHADNFGNNDYILSNTKSWTEQMVKAGYPANRISLQTATIDETKFYPRILPENDTYYSADVAFCGNYNQGYQEMVNEWISGYSQGSDQTTRELISKFFQQVLDKLRADIYQGVISSPDYCSQLIKTNLEKVTFRSTPEFVAGLTEIIFGNLTYVLNREYIIKSIIDAGIHLKIWGRNWDMIQEFTPYAQGLAQHGEELSKVYSGSKIVIGTCGLYTGHFRIWESISCGALAMSRYIPPEIDILDIRDYLSEGDGFVFYRDHEDLIDKINYYLIHEDERNQIVARGQKLVKERLTYLVAAKKCLDFIKNDLLMQ